MCIRDRCYKLYWLLLSIIGLLRCLETSFNLRRTCSRWNNLRGRGTKVEMYNCQYFFMKGTSKVSDMTLFCFLSCFYCERILFCKVLFVHIYNYLFSKFLIKSKVRYRVMSKCDVCNLQRFEGYCLLTTEDNLSNQVTSFINFLSNVGWLEILRLNYFWASRFALCVFSWTVITLLMLSLIHI